MTLRENRSVEEVYKSEPKYATTTTYMTHTKLFNDLRKNSLYNRSSVERNDEDDEDDEDSSTKGLLSSEQKESIAENMDEEQQNSRQVPVRRGERIRKILSRSSDEGYYTLKHQNRGGVI
jgi:hypothetical protein